MSRTVEFDAKLKTLRTHMAERGIPAAAIATRSNFAWLTAGGRNHVSTAVASGPGTLVVTPGSALLVANNIELDRLLEEECGGLALEGVSFPWHEPSRRDEAIREAAGGDTAADTDPSLATMLQQLRTTLIEPEASRLRELGGLAVSVVERTCRGLERGESERAIAARVRSGAIERGAEAPVCLIAADERIDTRRHPLATDKPVERRVMVVAVLEKAGLHASVTRLVSFGPLSDELRRRHDAVCYVDRAANAGTRPGRTLSEILRDIVSAYESVGFADEWRRHHQGGLAGYAPREVIATPTSDHLVAPMQSFAWNPSIAGTKSEDTVLSTEDKVEWITAPGDGWPVPPGETDRAWARADWLIR